MSRTLLQQQLRYRYSVGSSHKNVLLHYAPIPVELIKHFFRVSLTRMRIEISLLKVVPATQPEKWVHPSVGICKEWTVTASNNSWLEEYYYESAWRAKKCSPVIHLQAIKSWEWKGWG